MERLTVSDAAKKLKVTPDAVRQRIRRNTIEWEQDENGKYYVLVDTSSIPSEPVADDVANAMVERLQEENWFLRRELDRRAIELERRDAIMISLTEGLKALEPARQEEITSDEDEQEVHSDNRSWWRRFFGF